MAVDEQQRVSVAGGRRVGRKVGRKPAFTEDDVVRAALAEGIDRFTLGAVADRLGVVTAAIYRVFSSRDELVVACLDRAGGSFRRPPSGSPWDDTLRFWADECWRLCEEYPGLERAVYAYTPAFTRIADVFGDYAEVLGEREITRAQAMFALGFIGDTVFTGHQWVSSLRATDDSGATGLDRLSAAVDDGRYIDGMPPHENWADRTSTDRKVEFIITGLAHHWPGD